MNIRGRDLVQNPYRREIDFMLGPEVSILASLLGERIYSYKRTGRRQC